MTATATLSRTLTTEESSAIASVDLTNLPNVQISYHSNPNNVYTYEASEDYASDLVDVIADADLLGRSLGTFISEGRRSGDLREVQV
jgi:hypothetical protein